MRGSVAMNTGLLPGGLDLLAQLIDEDPQIFDLIAILRSPDGLQEALVRYGFVGLGNQIAQNIEFGGCEPHCIAVRHDLAIGEIHFESGHRNFLRRGIGRETGAAQGGAHAGHQLIEAERFGSPRPWGPDRTDPRWRRSSWRRESTRSSRAKGPLRRSQHVAARGGELVELHFQRVPDAPGPTAAIGCDGNAGAHGEPYATHMRNGSRPSHSVPVQSSRPELVWASESSR